MGKKLIHAAGGALSAAFAFFLGFAILTILLGVVGIYVATWALPGLLALSGAIIAIKPNRRMFATGWTISSVAIFLYFAITWN